MVKAIDFAVRTSAGNVVRGAVSGEGRSEFLQVGSGESVSLNLSQSSVLGYERQGSDLVLKLSDGRSITLSNYFEANAGEDNKLYLSTNGEVTEVYLTDGGNGTLYANYGPVDTWNKYSAVDDLRFVEDNTLIAAEGYADDTVGMGMFAPALLGLGGGGLGTAAAVAGGLGVLGAVTGGGTSGGDGGSTRIPPTVNEATGSKDITTNSLDKTVTVSGTGQPGETVVVNVGTKTQTTTINDNGTWETVFSGGNFPGDGSFEAVVKVTAATGTTQTLDGPAFVIDLTPPLVSSTQGTVSAGDIENLAEYQNGVTINGEGEVGANITVVIQGHTQSTTVGSDGTWNVTFTQAQIPAGDNVFPATITATDAMGNKTVITDSLHVDTIPHPLSFNTTAGDNIVNKVESSGEVTVTGQSTAGAMVTVNLGNASQVVETNTNGVWTVRYPAGTFVADGTSMVLTASTIDSAGNPSTASQTIKIDTSTAVSFTTQPLFGGDNVINGTEAQSEITMSGQSEAGTQSVSVTWNYVTVPATVAENGDWTVKFPSSAVPATGTSTATVNSIDAVGNAGTNTHTISVDRETAVAVNAGQAGGDNIIMSTEANAGVTLTGTAERGAKVEVTFQGNTHSVTASNTGTWSTKFESAEITRGTYFNGPNNLVSVKSTDLAGNIATTSHTLNVDTEVTNFARTSTSTGIDNVLNNAEALQGLTVTGTVEANATSVKVMFGNNGPYNADISGTTWSVKVPANVIPQGENKVQLTAVATDQYGNVSAPHTEMIDVDRIVTPFTRSGGMIGGDGMLNASEIAGGLDLNGTGEVGARIVVSLQNGASQEVVVGDNGLWSTQFEASQLPRSSGESMSVTFNATDKAGNVHPGFTETVLVDTIAPDGANITNFIKNAAGTNLTGVILDENVTSDFSFYRVGTSGSTSKLALSNSLGSPFAQFNDAVPDGEFLVINHGDTAGNGAATLYLSSDTNSVSSTTIDLNNAAFKNFDFTSLDLSSAKTAMTISAEDLIAITGPDKTLMIKGGADDTISLRNAALAADQSSAEAGYKLYTLGDNAASLYIDEDIITTSI